MASPSPPSCSASCGSTGSARSCAIIFAAIALKRINESNGWRTGKGMAIAGLVLGLVGMGTLVLVFIAAAGSGGS